MLLAAVLVLPGPGAAAAAGGAGQVPGGRAPGSTNAPALAAPALAAPALAAPALAAVPSSGPAHRPPVDGGVARPFLAPAHEYGPGHRGVDLAAAAGTVVRSPAAGTVTFAGQVAGRGVVVVAHAGGTLTSLEPVASTVARGTPVRAGSPVAVVAAAPPHAGCAGGCVHWGVRVGGRYVDPVWWLGGGRPVRLLPMAGPL